jgi:hypothetical protein
MELNTGSGAGLADILYVTKSGQLVLVETKLWRNAEARREVVAQILDYAKQLTTWKYEDLSRETAVASKRGPSHLLDCVRELHPKLDEASFVDGINRSLRTGDFLLIIAGDGIRYGAESLVAFIENFGNLRFRLAIVEVAAYQLPNIGFLLQPRILAKTEVLQRTVFIGQSIAQIGEIEEQSDPLQVDNDRSEKNNQLAAWFENFWKEYIAVLRLDDMQQPPPRPGKSTNIALQMPPGNSQAWISVFVAKSQNIGGVFLTFAGAFANAPDFYNQLYADREEIAKAVEGLSWECGANGKVWIKVPTIKLGDLEDESNRHRVVSYLAEQTNKMVNVFRHRLEALSKERLAN